jgi:hypothetical protein
VKFLSSKRRVLALAGGILLFLFLLRPGASRLKSRISGSISAALGRRVEIASVKLRMLPRPGFDLENLVVDEDPAFGAEPMLRAADVTAVLRLTSLVRGKLEIARLDLTEPSLNLVHGDNGRWNLEALLERTAQSPLAPTAKAKSESRPAFPYIEASSARINFKNGNVKRPYALVDADFALWQESENAWGVRLKARPFRSDLNLSDIGLLRVNGSWQRAPSLRETPLQFSVEWERAQLGQLTKFLTGADKGWRGTVLLDTTLAGTPANLKIRSDVSVRDFRRYDITTGPELRLAAHCDARYSSLDHVLHEIGCNGPVGGGAIALAGDAGLPGSHYYDLAVTATNVPMRNLAAAALHAKKNLSEDLGVSGTLNGSFTIQQKNGLASSVRVAGDGEIAGFHLRSAKLNVALDADRIPLQVRSSNWWEKVSHARRRSPQPRMPDVVRAGGAVVEVGPFPAALNRSSAAVARAWVSRAGYGASVVGEADIARTLRLAKLFGLPVVNVAADGTAQVDLQIAGSWTAPPGSPGFPGPQVTGSAKLHNVRAEVRGVDGPIEISSADMELLRDRIRVTRLNATAAHTAWTGSLELPRGCGIPSACVVQFALKADDIALGVLSQWIAPHPKQLPWYRILSPATQAGPSFAADLRAAGKISVGRFRMHNVVATRVSADVDLDAGKLQVSDLRADFLGGKHRGEWQADFTVRPAAYSGKGIFTDVSLGQVSDAMGDQWISGSGDANYQLSASGASADEFWQSAKGTMDFQTRTGSLPHISLANGAGPLKVERFRGRAHLQSGKIEIKEARLESPSGTYLMSGTASFSRELDLTLAGNRRLGTPSAGRGYAITGTLAEPVVAPNPETQAKLKP